MRGALRSLKILCTITRPEATSSAMRRGTRTVMPHAQNEGVKIYYEVHGGGYPLVFIHGGGGNTIAWFQQVPFFSRNYKVITVDLRGFKNSHCPPDLDH